MAVAVTVPFTIIRIFMMQFCLEGVDSDFGVPVWMSAAEAEHTEATSQANSARLPVTKVNASAMAVLEFRQVVYERRQHKRHQVEKGTASAEERRTPERRVRRSSVPHRTWTCLTPVASAA
jgi:hypothetical protein